MKSDPKLDSNVEATAISDSLGLFPRGETETEEYKQSWQDKECAQALAAFANTRGGILWIGIKDNGQKVGWGGDGKDREKISNYIATKIGIHPASMTLETLDGVPVLAIRMTPASFPVACDGRYFRRVDNSTREIPATELPRFLLEKLGQSWDALPSDVAVGEFSQNAVNRFLELAENHLPEAAQNERGDLLIRKLDLVHASGSLKRAGVMLLTDKPVRWFPQARVQAAQVSADEIMLSNEQRFDGSLLEQLGGVLEWLKRHITITFQMKAESSNDLLSGLQRTEVWEIPFVALREALLNALIHRDYTAMSPIQVRLYSDRLCIENPGNLLAGLTTDDLKRQHISSPRNPLLADMAYRMRLIESWGTGTLRMISDCQKQGVPPPEFSNRPTGFQVTLYRSATPEALRLRGLSERQIGVMEFVWKEGSITNRQLRDLMSVSDEIARQELNGLADQGLLRRVGAGRSVKYLHFGSKESES